MECTCGGFVPADVRLCPSCGRTVNPNARAGTLGVGRARERMQGHNRPAMVEQPAKARNGPSLREVEQIVPEARRLIERKHQTGRINEEILGGNDRPVTDDGWTVIGYLAGESLPGSGKCAVLWRNGARRIRYMR